MDSHSIIFQFCFCHEHLHIKLTLPNLYFNFHRGENCADFIEKQATAVIFLLFFVVFLDMSKAFSKINDGISVWLSSSLIHLIDNK